MAQPSLFAECHISNACTRPGLTGRFFNVLLYSQRAKKSDVIRIIAGINLSIYARSLDMKPRSTPRHWPDNMKERNEDEMA
ncbi:hypothetical protein P364_0121425 [Paenibacillus sp. MAEPY2]|nr:hypothetical protein P364_0121425 [Paenibacillus sp. MAEPY2]KGP89507.1 hypothetical protein P363_0100865 [Paenibacillus sp. MAEPY1]OZQ63182.1 hypothetical protein CA599_24840 [Paenibacillus taichungensis]